MTFPEALQYGADFLGITLEKYRPDDSYLSDPGGGEVIASKEEPQQDHQETKGNPQPQENLRDYYKECRRRLQEDPAAQEARDYITGRGISLKMADDFWIGYDPNSDPAQSNHPCKRVIIPTSFSHYVGRRIDGVEICKKLNNRGGSPQVFNKKALYNENIRIIFVVEGAFDAMAVMEAGGIAVAINSVDNKRRFIELMEQKPTKAALVICLDNDGKTADATKYIQGELDRLGIRNITADICGKSKDPNDALLEDRAGFEKAIIKAMETVAYRPDSTSAYIDTLMDGDIQRFKEAGEKKTGYTYLDKETGGLYAGLYVVAALSSLGKTTFMSQLSDQLATAGHDVIFFSLEQSRLELISKSLTRIIAEDDPFSKINSLSLRRGYYEKARRDAAERYKERVGNRLSILEANFNYNVGHVCQYIKDYINDTGKRPVVVIDYLQILQPEPTDKNMSLRESIDKTVNTLKMLSRDLELTIFVISSINRMNYANQIDLSSLKESGGIEYSADVVWGLQYRSCTNDETFTKRDDNQSARRKKINDEKSKDKREIDLVCLKNRYGRVGFVCWFDYTPAIDTFISVKNTGDKQRKEEQQRDEDDVFGRFDGPVINM